MKINLPLKKIEISLPAGGSAIHFYLGTNNDTDVPDRIVNNFIYINTTGANYGIYSHSNDRAMEIIHNSIHITGDATGSSNIYLPDITPVVKNNILINNAGGKAMSTNFTDNSSDYNCLFSTGTYLVNLKGTLRQHQLATGSDMHSFYLDPVFDIRY